MSINGPRKGRVIVSGILFWYPLAGVTYQFLHYLVGLRQLGFEPYYIEDSARWVYDPILGDVSSDASRNIETVLPSLRTFGFGENWAFRGNYPGGKCYGMSEEQILRLYREADAFLNVTGAQEMREEQMACKRRIYVESDPFAIQVKFAQGDAAVKDMLAAHDMHFSFGENLGSPDCDVPIERFNWLPTRQPVAVQLWNNPYDNQGAAYNTITNWSNKAKDLMYRGEIYYWTKDREFEKFLDLPRRRNVPFELATTTTEDVHRMLSDHGWRYTEAVDVSQDVARYRAYIQNARGEFTVARDQYVRPHTGWFSDRSACYLAASRPVITQETGFSKFLPSGKGLFGFTTMDDILSAVDAIESDYEGNCRAARDIAEEYFAAEKVVGSLMDRAGL